MPQLLNVTKLLSSSGLTPDRGRHLVRGVVKAVCRVMVLWRLSLMAEPNVIFEMLHSFLL